MKAYATAAELKTYLGVSASSDDALLTDLLARATRAVETYTLRTFDAAAGTRYYDATAVDGDTLLLDSDLHSAISVTNGRGQVITQYWLLPRNAPPYHALKLKSGSAYSWSFATDGEIEVYGLWGYSADPPDDIVHATLRLAAYYYRQKDAQVFDVTALPEEGQIVIPKGLPADVKQLLGPYRRLGVA